MLIAAYRKEHVLLFDISVLLRAVSLSEYKYQTNLNTKLLRSPQAKGAITSGLGKTRVWPDRD